jgi:hypothetical protein
MKNKLFAKSYCEIHMRIMLVCTLYIIKYGKSYSGDLTRLEKLTRYKHFSLLRKMCTNSHVCFMYIRYLCYGCKTLDILPTPLIFDVILLTKNWDNMRACIRHQCMKTTFLSCHRCLLKTGIEKISNI